MCRSPCEGGLAVRELRKTGGNSAIQWPFEERTDETGLARGLDYVEAMASTARPPPDRSRAANSRSTRVRQRSGARRPPMIRTSRSPKMCAPRTKASCSVAATPAAWVLSHQRARCSSDRKKFSMCQSEAQAFARTSSRRPIHTIASPLSSGASGASPRSIASPQS
jgi:hypothetical protein